MSGWCDEQRARVSADAWRVREAIASDAAALRRLSAQHYRAGDPAVPALTLVACDGREVCGMMVVAYPTLNAPWRAHAWPEVFGIARTPRELAGVTNAFVRTIARVVVSPRHRGLGVARALVGAYLREAQTPMTEAVAAMGAYSPFFERSGMRRVEAPPSGRDRRLAARLRALGEEPIDLVELGRARRVVRARAEVARAVRAWAGGSKATRRRAGQSPERLAAQAACALLSPRVVFVAP